MSPWRRRLRRQRLDDDDPCLPLAVALRHLQSTYGPPKTRAQINAWNEAERALEDLRERLIKDARHGNVNPES